MNEWYAQAVKKLETEKGSGHYDRYAGAMKDAVFEALDGFCSQDAEFAQAVVQGGTFADCIKSEGVDRYIGFRVGRFSFLNQLPEHS